MEGWRKEMSLGPVVKNGNTKSRLRDRSGLAFDREGVVTGAVGLHTFVLMRIPD